MDTEPAPQSLPRNHAQLTALDGALAVLVLVAASGFFWLRDGSAQSWPVYVLALLLPVYHRRQLLLVASSPASWWLAGTLVWAVFSIAWSTTGMGDAGRMCATMLCLYAWLVALAHLTHIERFWAAYQGALLMAAALSALAAVMWMFDAYQQHGRLAGFNRLENFAVAAYVWGGLAVVALRLALHALIRAPLRIAAGLLFAALTLAVLATETRSAIAALILLAALSLVRGRHRWVTLVAAPLAAAAVFLGIAFLLELPLLADVPRAVQNNVRVEIWQTAFAELGMRDWLVGIGIASPSSVTLAGGGLYDHPHGLFLSVLVQTGFVGLVLFVGLTASAAIGAWRRAPGDPIADCALWSLMWICLTGILDGSIPFAKIDHLWLLYWAPLVFALHGRQHSRA